MQTAIQWAKHWRGMGRAERDDRNAGLLGRGCVNVLGLAGARHAVRQKRGESGALSVRVCALGCGARSSLRKALNRGHQCPLQVR